MIVKSSSSMNKTNIFWTITLTRGKYHQYPLIDGKWFDYLNLASIIIHKLAQDFCPIVSFSAGNVSMFSYVVASVVKRIGGIWHLSTHFLSPALLCINYDLSLGISKCYSASSLEDKGLKQRKNLQILFTEKWYLKVSEHISFLWQIGLVLWPPTVCVETNTL